MADAKPQVADRRATELRERVRAAMPRVRKVHEALVRIPSVSASGHDPEPLRRSADAVAKAFADAGIESRVISVEGGHPAVVGRVAGPGAGRKVLLYAHHDVQTEGPRERWQDDPFEPTEKDGRLYGRGSADDKAGIAVHLAAILAHGSKPPCDVALFIEGEEEAGSKHLRTYLEKEKALLAADAVILADSANWRIGQPALTVSLRGNVIVTVRVRVLDHAVHSGAYGGVFPDALMALSRLLASLHDDAGNVAVEGLRGDDADPLDLTEEELRGYTGARPSLRAIGKGSLTSRLWSRPSLSITGIDAPSVHEASNQLVPEARAKVSLRIPPGQPAAAAQDALVRHLERSAPWGAEVVVTRESTGEAFTSARSGPAYEAFHRAMAEAWGRKGIDVGLGGSIPFLADFAEVFPRAALLVTGVEDPTSNAHSENESVHLGELENAAVAEALFLEHFART
ncbi:MAG TPA: dipeptidase [Candidatus Limnocylindria bacterium]|nr:dipeptidase [Candidatus Limnocylindria bacterium]